MLPVMNAVKICPRPRKATALTIPVVRVSTTSAFGSGSGLAGTDMWVPFRRLALTPAHVPAGTGRRSRYAPATDTSTAMHAMNTSPALFSPIGPVSRPTPITGTEMPV